MSAILRYVTDNHLVLDSACSSWSTRLRSHPRRFVTVLLCQNSGSQHWEIQRVHDRRVRRAFSMVQSLAVSPTCRPFFEKQQYRGSAGWATLACASHLSLSSDYVLFRCISTLCICIEYRHASCQGNTKPLQKQTQFEESSRQTRRPRN